MNPMFYGWLVIAILFLLLEIGSPGLFYFLSFSFGAALSSVLSMYGVSLMGQSILFLIGSVGALMLLKRFVQKQEQGKKSETNIYALRGKHALVLVAIEPTKFGQIKIGGEQWSARAHDNGHIEAGATVEVVAIRGAHIVVKKLI